MFCTSCGSPLAEDVRFCGACGAPVTAVPQSAVPPPLPAAAPHVLPVASAPRVVPVAPFSAVRVPAPVPPAYAPPPPAYAPAAGYALRTAAPAVPLVQRVMMRVHAWMAGGLLLTAFTAWITSHSDAMLELLYGGGKGPLIVLFLVQLGLVAGTSALAQKAAAPAAACLFLLYSALEGVVLSGLLLVFSTETLAHAFVCAALSFGAMSILGLTTRRDLSGLGGWLLMGLIGLVVAMVVNLVLGNEGTPAVLSFFAVALFLGLTVYDTFQIRKEVAAAVEENGGDEAAVAPRVDALAIGGALSLYLDFLNLFLHLVNLFSDDD